MLRKRAWLALVLAMLLDGQAVLAQRAQPIVAFDPPTLPEGLAMDPSGTLYVGIATTGEIRRVSPGGEQTPLAKLRPGLGSLLGLVVAPEGGLIAALNSRNTPGSDTHGIWRIGEDGATSLLAAMPATTMPNALVYGGGDALYISDSARGAIWRRLPDGTFGPWLQHELLTGDLQTCPPPVLSSPVGANGLAFVTAHAELLVANTTRALIARVPILVDGRAGEPSIVAGPDCAALGGADGLGADARGTLYASLNWHDRVVRLDGSEVHIVATKADGLDFPASVVAADDRVVVTNFAQLAFLNNTSPRPGLVVVEVSR